MDFFIEKKKAIAQELKIFLDQKGKELSKINNWAADITQRLYDFTSLGKMIRGGLVMLAHDLYNGKSPNEALKSALIMELYQSAFLIHDDIMDRDTMRRGNPSFFFQYKQKADQAQLPDPYHYGESLGICAGDIAFFLGFEIISLLDLKPEQKVLLNQICAREVSYVGLAQIQDVHLGYLKEAPNEDAIMNVYLYKTGRYTFSLPLLTGSIIAGKTEAEAADLVSLGEYLGMIFQLKDDEIGLFGKEEEIGKPVGSDIKENKKTLYHYYLFQTAQGKERDELKAIFGNAQISAADIQKVRDVIQRLGVQERVQNKIQDLYQKSTAILQKLSGNPEYLKTLAWLLQYSLERNK